MPEVSVSWKQTGIAGWVFTFTCNVCGKRFMACGERVEMQQVMEQHDWHREYECKGMTHASL